MEISGKKLVPWLVLLILSGVIGGSIAGKWGREKMKKFREQDPQTQRGS
jgi:hypothetical protein